MYYVEMLRAWRVMRIFLIILGALFALAVIGRIFGHGSMNVGDYTVPPTAQHVTHSGSADGTEITTFDDKGQHVVFRSDRSGIQTVAVTELSARRSRHSYSHANFGIVSVTRSQHGTMTTTVSRTHKIPLDWLFGIAAFFVAIFGSILGLALSRENDGHLELTWTKPVRREAYAATIMVVDTCAMLVLTAITVGMCVAVLAMFGLAGIIVADQGTFSTVSVCLLFMLAFYALAMAATASLRRAGGIALALIWPASFILPGLTMVKWLNIGAVVRVVDTLNPIAYLPSFGGSEEGAHMLTLVPLGVGYSIAALALITVAALLASLLQWRRLEA